MALPSNQGHIPRPYKRIEEEVLPVHACCITRVLAHTVCSETKSKHKCTIKETHIILQQLHLCLKLQKSTQQTFAVSYGKRVHVVHERSSWLDLAGSRLAPKHSHLFRDQIISDEQDIKQTSLGRIISRSQKMFQIKTDMYFCFKNWVEDGRTTADRDWKMILFFMSMRSA